MPLKKAETKSMLEEIRKIVEGGNSRPDDHNA